VGFWVYGEHFGRWRYECVDIEIIVGRWKLS
jgi:hypothetical protein